MGSGQVMIRPEDAVGRQGYYDASNELTILVEVKNTREKFGRVDYLVEPVAGKGERWVYSSKVKLLPDE